MKFTLLGALAAIAINVLWGANTVAVKLGLQAAPPLTSAFIRFAIGLACIWLWARAMRLPLAPRPGEWPGFIALAALFGVQIAMMNFGVDRSGAGIAAVLGSAHPIFAALLAHRFLGDRINTGKGAGLAVAFAGTVLVLLADPGSPGFGRVSTGSWLLLASSALLGARLVLTARLVRDAEPARPIFWLMALALPGFLAGALAFETFDWRTLDGPSIAGLLYQGVVVAGLGFVALAYLLKRFATTATVSFGFLNPVSGVGLSAWLLGEPVTVGFLAGLAAVAVGLVMIARG